MLISPMSSNPRLPRSALACVNSRCDVYGQPGEENLIVRKIYGKDNIRYLRCRCCGEEFSERKGTALWNTKLSEERAIAVGRQLAEGTSLKGTSRLTHSHRDTVRRLIRKFGEHAERFHNQKAQQLDIEVLEMDERHGFVESKAERCWDAVAIAAASKFIVQVEVGPRTQPLFERLMHSSAARLAHPQDLVLMTDGEACSRTLFPSSSAYPTSPPASPTGPPSCCALPHPQNPSPCANRQTPSGQKARISRCV